MCKIRFRSQARAHARTHAHTPSLDDSRGAKMPYRISAVGCTTSRQQQGMIWGRSGPDSGVYDTWCRHTMGKQTVVTCLKRTGQGQNGNDVVWWSLRSQITYVCMYVQMCVCMCVCVCMYVCMYVCMNVCTCT